MRGAGKALLLLGALTLLLTREGLSTPVGPLITLCPPDDRCTALDPSYLPPFQHECYTKRDCLKNQICCPTACTRKCKSQWPGIPPENGPDDTPPKHLWPPEGKPPKHPLSPDDIRPKLPWFPDGIPPIHPWFPNGIPPNHPWSPNGNPPEGPWSPDGIPPEGPWFPDGPVGIPPDA